jgi:protein TonB
VPPTLVTAPLPDLGAASNAGTALPGPGTASGGTGTGTGEAGDGPGGGGTPARWLRGRITGADYPRAANDAGTQGTLWSRYVVGTDGRVKSCTVTRSSGSALLDDTTCRLIIERFRYRPARDANGRRTTDVVIEDHHWVLDPQR